MSRTQPLWLLLCLGLAAAVNHVMRPRVVYELSPGERTLITGTLRIDDGGGARELQLATIHLVTARVERPLTAPLVVHELWIRGPESSEQPEPDLELFVDFDPDGSAPQEPSDIARRELPVLGTALGSRAHSRIRFAGAEKASRVIDGRLQLRQVLPATGTATYRINGDVELTLETEAGQRSLRGQLDARLVWDPRG